jgi:hypothetical protein
LLYERNAPSLKIVQLGTTRPLWSRRKFVPIDHREMPLPHGRIASTTGR